MYSVAMFFKRVSFKMSPNKSCQVVLRCNNNLVEILAFRHPIAGVQLVKGTIERDESAQQTAIRELREEAGLLNAVITGDLGTWETGYQDQIWSFHLCSIDTQLPDAWDYFTFDDGGHLFSFFWHPIDAELAEDWHEVFRGAITFVREALQQ